MRRLLAFLLLGLTAAPAVFADAAADKAALTRVERYLDSLSSIRADFVQTLSDARGGVETSRGKLSIRKPGRFRWDYSEPEQLIVSDGRDLWFYDADLQQATRRQLGESLSQTPAMLLSGQARIDTGFTVSDGGRSDGLDWVRLEPRLRDTDFRELRLGFAGGELKRMELTTKLNQLTRIDFSNTERNLKLDDATFRFTPPKGVDVIGPAL